MRQHFHRQIDKDDGLGCTNELCLQARLLKEAERSQEIADEYADLSDTESSSFMQSRAEAFNLAAQWAEEDDIRTRRYV